jgi:hypothetical protein
MNTESSFRSVAGSLKGMWRGLTGGRGLNRGAAWGMMIIGALVAFELFNFGTTQFALHDVLGDLTFAGLRWATVLATAFCAIDFAGIARIFTPQRGADEPAEVWYLFGAWLLAAGFNATLTWWGVSVAIVNHASAGSAAVIGSATLTKVVPVFVAVMVWLIRVLIIGTFSMAGDKLFSTADRRPDRQRSYRPQGPAPQANAAALRSASAAAHPISSSYRPAPKPSAQASFDSAEPVYESLAYDAAREPSRGERRLQ